MSEVTPVLFAEALLKRLDLPVTDNNIRALVAFQFQEGGHSNGATFNPLNTRLQMPGSVNFITKKPGGGAEQAYQSWADGLEATARTMSQENMRSIYNSLRVNAAPAATINAIGNSSWGWWDPKKGFSFKLPHLAADAIVKSESAFRSYGARAYSGAGGLSFISSTADKYGMMILAGALAVGGLVLVARVLKKRREG